MQNENTTIKEFTEFLMKCYGIEISPRNFHKIRTKVTRTIKDKGFWDKLNSINGIKVLSAHQQDLVFNSVKNYMLKVVEEQNSESTSNPSPLIFNLNNSIQSIPRNDVLNGVTEEMEINAMIRAIFYIFYESIDLEQWEKDLFIRKYVEKESILNMVEDRLRRPEKYYTKKRDKFDF